MPRAQSDLLLRVKGVSKSFRGIQALKDVSFSVREGEIVGLIGPNGAGKTTLFNVIAGTFAPDEGDILFKEKTLCGLKPHEVCAAGIGRTFQIVRPFHGLTVEENVMIGALFHTSSLAIAREKAHSILKMLHLSSKKWHYARSLTLPERKRLEVARALSTRPTLLLLDEVMAGLRPSETAELIEIFQDLNQNLNLTIVMIEHVMQAVMQLSHHIVVLNEGELIAEGEPRFISQHEKVLACYLGVA